MDASTISTLPARGRLGERLLHGGLVAPRQLAEALQDQQRTGALLGEILVRLGHLAPRALGPALAAQAGVPWLDLAEVIPGPGGPGPGARTPGPPTAGAAPGPEREVLRLAMANIFDLDALGRGGGLTPPAGWRWPAPTEEDLQARPAQAYGDRTQHGRGGRRRPSARRRPATEAAERSCPSPAWWTSCCSRPCGTGPRTCTCSPGNTPWSCRYRVDGALVSGPSLPKALQAPVTGPAQGAWPRWTSPNRRRPQDGKFRLPPRRRPVDVRASFLPVQHGEKVVLRFLDKSQPDPGPGPAGHAGPACWTASPPCWRRPHGVILVTGPTGSRQDHHPLFGPEPPQHRRPLHRHGGGPGGVPAAAGHPGGVNLKAGLTFAAGLRAILRQDPDIILVGEIRDPETAGIALRAAMTGHLVLSTLHTNDPVGAMPRLQDMGVARPGAGRGAPGHPRPAPGARELPGLRRAVTSPSPEALAQLKRPGAGADGSGRRLRGLRLHRRQGPPGDARPAARDSAGAGPGGRRRAAWRRWRPWPAARARPACASMPWPWPGRAPSPWTRPCGSRWRRIDRARLRLHRPQQRRRSPAGAARRGERDGAWPQELARRACS